MTLPIQHAWRRRLLTILAIAAVLVATGSQLASAKPVKQDIHRDEVKAFCQLAGGTWMEDEWSGTYGCYFDDWEMICDGVTCEITCDTGTKCVDERTASSTLRQASLADNQQVVEPEPTPQKGPRGRGRSTPADEPLVVAPVSTAEPEPIVIESPHTDPVVVVINPA